MFVWTAIAGLLVLTLAALLMLTWSEEPPADDTVDPDRVPTGDRRGGVTPAYLRDVRIPGQGRGYDRASVDVLLQRAADALEQATSAISATSATSGEEVEDGGGDEAGGLDR